MWFNFLFFLGSRWYYCQEDQPSIAHWNLWRAYDSWSMQHGCWEAWRLSHWTGSVVMSTQWRRFLTHNVFLPFENQTYFSFLRDSWIAVMLKYCMECSSIRNYLIYLISYWSNYWLLILQTKVFSLKKIYYGKLHGLFFSICSFDSLSNIIARFNAIRSCGR